MRLALENEERVFASDLEILRGGKSYTLDTLLELKRRYPGAELFLIVGSDTLGDLPNWHKPEEVLKIADVLCVPRLGLDENDEAAAAALTARFGARVRRLSAKASRISSTQVREALERGEPVSGLLPEAVEQAVYEEGAVFPGGGARSAGKVPGSAERQSAIRTRQARCARRRALPKLGGRTLFKRGRPALLHDCAKCLDSVTQEVLSGDETGITPVCHAFGGGGACKDALRRDGRRGAAGRAAAHDRGRGHDEL